MDAAFAHAGLDPADHVVEDEALLRPADVENLVADSTLARERLGWTPATSFEELVTLMVDADLARIASAAGAL